MRWRTTCHIVGYSLSPEKTILKVFSPQYLFLNTFHLNSIFCPENTTKHYLVTWTERLFFFFMSLQNVISYISISRMGKKKSFSRNIYVSPKLNHMQMQQNSERIHLKEKSSCDFNTKFMHVFIADLVPLIFFFLLYAFQLIKCSTPNSFHKWQSVCWTTECDSMTAFIFSSFGFCH